MSWCVLCCWKNKILFLSDWEYHCCCDLWLAKCWLCIALCCLFSQVTSHVLTQIWLNWLFSILDSFKCLNFFLHISVNVYTSMTKYGLLFCETCWMLVDCNTEQYTQLNNIDYLYDVFDPFGGFAIMMVLFLWWLCHCSGFCIRQCGISELGYLWCILCLYGWHCEYGDTTVTDLSWYMPVD